MADPDKKRLTELELEAEQGERLMEVFRLIKTYDAREGVVAPEGSLAYVPKFLKRGSCSVFEFG